MTQPVVAVRARRSTRGRAAGVLVLLAALTALCVVTDWLRTAGTTPLTGTVPVDVSGSQVAPGIVAAAVALLAAAAAVGLVGRAGRWVVAAVVAACGVVVVGSTTSVLADPHAAAVPVVAGVTGVGHLVGDVTTTVWPWVAIGVGLLDLLGAVWLVRTSRSWRGTSRRHETAARTAGADVDDERSAWDSLSRGDDPS